MRAVATVIFIDVLLFCLFLMLVIAIAFREMKDITFFQYVVLIPSIGISGVGLHNVIVWVIN